MTRHAGYNNADLRRTDLDIKITGVTQHMQCFSSGVMSSFRKGHAALLVLALTQCSVFATSNNASNEVENSTEMIGRYLKLPWMKGLDWLANSSEYPDVKKVKTFIRAVLAGETWAAQILDTLYEDFPDMEKRRVRYVRETHGKINCKCTGADSDNDTVIEDGHCGASAERSKDFSMAEMATIVFFSTIGVVLLGCMICDFVARKSPEKSSATVDTLAKFSLYRNALAVLNTKSDADSMPALHGLRCLGFFVVIFGHRWGQLYLMFNEQIFILDFIKIKNTLFGFCWEMAPYAIETFGVIGGYLVAHMFCKAKKSGLKLNVFTMYLYRYLRLTPCLAIVLLVVVVFSDRSGSGPMWNGIDTYAVDNCRENWWINFLYLQNVLHPDRICLLHTWTLGLDMQLFWISPLILYPLYYSRKLGLRMLSFFLVAAVLTPTVILTVKGYTHSLLRLDMDIPSVANNFSFYHVSTYNRAFAYLVGILLGYDVATRKRHLTKTNVAINWTVAGLLILFCTWFNNFVYNSGFVGDWHVEIPAALLLRPSWSIVVAWVVYACTQGYGGWATKFLSLPIFLPLSRLSYCIYLVHMPIQVINISSFYGSTNPSPTSHIVNGVFGDLVLSTAVAFVLNLCIESPSIVLTKILLRNHDREPKVTSLHKESNNGLNGATEKDSKAD